MSEIKERTFSICDGFPIILSVGKFAKLANGSCTIQCGDTVVLSTVCSSDMINENIDFFPLQVEYREKYSASGTVPGGYIKREGKPSDRDIIISRITDRSIRPLFSTNYRNEIQLCSTLLSVDKINNPDILSIISASLSLCISDLPFDGPIGALRVGLIDGKFIANPTFEEMELSKLNLIYAGKNNQVLMIEGDAKEIDEDTFKEALEFANKHIDIQIEAQLEIIKMIGKEKKTVLSVKLLEDLRLDIKQFCDNFNFNEICFIADKRNRSQELESIFIKLKDKLSLIYNDKVKCNYLNLMLKSLYDEYVKFVTRSMIINNNKRLDGRNFDELRTIKAEISVLPDRVHGTGLFSRGNTQSLAMITLGSKRDAQEVDSVVGINRFMKKYFYLHYNFPGYSVGEVKRIMGPGRREIGHANLAERSVIGVIPKDYCYSIRCVSEIMTSNGSTSMASVCSASLALMDAGIPIKKHISGISCGLIKEKNKEILLLDITGAEDYYGDMDFKIAGTRDGITGFQLDLKIPGISIDLMYKAMKCNKLGRMKIIDVLENCISKPKFDLSKYAPQHRSIKINTDKIGILIGPGGKNIKSITEETGVDINIDNNGTVNIFSIDKKSMDRAVLRVENCTSDIKIGQVYVGKVKLINKIGMFVEILPGRDGFVHISEIANFYVKNIFDLYKNGDEVNVKVINVENSRIKLTCKDVNNSNK